MDVGKNLILPYLIDGKTGDTYYISLLTVHLFNVVNNANKDEKDRMNSCMKG